MGVRLYATSVLAVALFAAAVSLSGAQGTGPQSTQQLQSAVGSAFTYQGRLTQGSGPATGPVDLRFILYNQDSGGSQVGNTISLEDVPVYDGVFSVQLDFGRLSDEALWLEVGVRPGASTSEFTTLSPRQRLTPVPFALRSEDAWSLSGNSNATGSSFLGTTNGEPLVFRTNSSEAMRIDTAGNVGIGTSGPAAKLEATSGGTGNIGVLGTSTSRGVVGRLGIISCPGSYGVGGCADTADGVYGYSASGVGVHGESNANRAVEGISHNGIGVLGDSPTRGVVGTLGGTSCAGEYAVGGCAGAAVAAGVYGRSAGAVGVLASTDTGDIFRGVTGAGEINQARINAAGRGYFNGGTQTGGADYAESMRTTDDPAVLQPGDVLVLDPAQGNAVRRSTEPYSRLVVGVYSTKPSVLAVGDHGVDDALAGEVPVALLGVVPTKVSAENGAIQIGDLLVTSSLLGRAMRARPEIVGGVAVYPTGAVLGKALEPLASGVGVIRVLVTLR